MTILLDQYKNNFRSFLTQLGPLSDKAWSELDSIIYLKKYKKDDVILMKGSIETNSRFIIEGYVRCTFYDTDSWYVYDFRKPNEPCVETISLLNGTPSQISLEAITDLKVLEMERNSFLDVVYANKDLMKVIMLAINFYLNTTHIRQCYIRTHSAMERYELFQKDFKEITPYVKLEHVASYLNITQQSLSRLRKNI